MAEALGTATSVVAVIELSAKVASICLEYSRKVKHSKEDIARVQKEVEDLKNVSEKLQTLLQSPQAGRLNATRELDRALKEGQTELQNLKNKLEISEAKKSWLNRKLRALKWPFESEEVEGIVETFRKHRQTIVLGLQVDQTSMLLDMQQKAVLAKLPIAKGASFDSSAEWNNPTCLENTRVEVLSQITKWAEDPDSKAIFWLNGMAGTGKSTISRTLAQLAAKRGHLGASFFFKRGEADRGATAKFFTTIAAQLVSQQPEIAESIQNAIDANPGICDKGLQEQFKVLIFDPLNKLPNDGQIHPLVIVVDALDECEKDRDIRILITLMSKVDDLRFIKLKMFLTSRPEVPTRLGFNKIQGKYKDIVLHEIDGPVIERDIRAYFDNELSRIKQDYNEDVADERRLPHVWPNPLHLDHLVKMAVPLFIFAATVCRFLSDRKGGNPDKKLLQVLKYETRSQESRFDPTYTPVLNQLLVDLSDREKAEALAQFRTVVGSIVVLADPLSVSSLSRILGVPRDDINDGLDMLHSVLGIPRCAESPIRLLHLSFREFLLDPQKKGKSEFWIDESQTHKELASHCLQVMQESLRMNICGLESPGTMLSSIDPQKIKDHIRPEIQYACRFWVFHLAKTGQLTSDGDAVHNFLERHFLHWLEVLALIGRTREALGILDALLNIVQADTGSSIRNFLTDARRFILAMATGIGEAPLQVYTSLIFVPTRSIIRAKFEKEIPQWISPLTEVDENWTQCLQTLEGHNRTVLSIEFSPDDKMIASGSMDGTVRLWSVGSGELHQIFEDHETSVTVVSFLPSGEALVSGSADGVIKIWSMITGEIQQTLVGHTKRVTNVCFSADEKWMASASDDGAIRLWSLSTGILHQAVEVPPGQCCAEYNRYIWNHPIKFQGEKILTVSQRDNTVWCWFPATGNLEKLTQGPPITNSTWRTFSPDGSMIASVLIEDPKLQIWSTTSGDIQQTLDLGCESLVISATFSPDGQTIAVAVASRTIQLWSTKTGLLQQVLEGHLLPIRTIAFASNGQVMASGSQDSAARLWSPALEQSYEGGDRISSLSNHVQDKQLVASISADNAIRLWSTVTGALESTIQINTNDRPYVAISPDAQLLAVFEFRSNKIQLCSVATGTLCRTLDFNPGEELLTRHVWSPDSKLLAAILDNNTIRLWSIATGEAHQTLQCYDGVYSARFSPDTKLIAAGDQAKRVYIWSTETGELQRIFEMPQEIARSVAFSPKVDQVAAASTKEILIWSLGTGGVLFKFEPVFGVGPLSFDPTGSHLLTWRGSFHWERTKDSGEIFWEGYGAGSHWVTWDGRRLLWLPQDYRLNATIYGSTLILESSSGRLFMLKLPPNGLVGI